MVTERKEITDDELVGDLVVAVLSVNTWTIEKTFKIQEGLREQGLFDAEAVAAMTETEVFSRLETAGYARGDFMIGMLAGRLLGVAKTLAGGGSAELRGLVEAEDAGGIGAFLGRMKGVGPAVIANYLALRGIGRG